MGAFNKTSSFVRQPDQIVRVNGRRTELVECVSYTAKSATFSAPSLLFDSYRESLRDGRVRVSVDGESAWAGYLDVDSGAENPDEGTVTFSGNTITAYFSKVWVGQTEFVPVKSYVLSDQVTPKKVLQDLFDNLPDVYRDHVKLGNASVLQDTDIELPPTMVFRNATYTAAIDQVTALFGDVSWTERHVGDVTYIDFYRIQDPGAPRTEAKIADWGDSVLRANVEEISLDITSTDCVTRVITYGAPRKFIISCITNHEDPLKQLQKDWDTTLEAAVLLNPAIAKPGAPGYLPGMEYVYRRYRLPEALVHFTKLKNLPFKRENGNDYKPQAWTYPTVLSNDPEGTGKIGTLSLTPELASSAKFELDQNQVIFSQPTLNIIATGKHPTTNKPTKTYAVAVVGITFAFESSEYIYFDTGHDFGSDVDLDIATEEGLVESIHREDLYYAQYTNANYPIIIEDEATGAETPLVFGAVIFNEDVPTTPPVTVPLETPLLVNDDTPILRRIALEKQREKSKRHRAYSVTIPYYTSAYREGYLLRISGQRDYVPDNYMITSVSHDLDNHSTTVSADNVKPPARTEIE